MQWASEQKPVFFGRLSIKLGVNTEENTYISLPGAGEERKFKKKKNQKGISEMPKYLFERLPKAIILPFILNCFSVA